MKKASIIIIIISANVAVWLFFCAFGRWGFEPIINLVPNGYSDRFFESIPYFWYGVALLFTNFTIKDRIRENPSYEFAEIAISFMMCVVITWIIESLQKGMGIAYFVTSIVFLLKHYGDLKKRAIK